MSYNGRFKLIAPALSGKSVCGRCKGKIAFGSPRYYNGSWMHAECALLYYSELVRQIKEELDKLYGMKE